MLDPATSMFIHDLATPLAVLFAGVANAVAFYATFLKRAARKEVIDEKLSDWVKEHQKEATARDQQLNKLLVLITEVKTTNEGQAIRIKMLEDEARDNRPKAPRGRLT